MIPYIMFVIKNVSNDAERNRIYDFLESYIMRRLICKKSTNSYSDLFSENLINADVKTADELKAFFDAKDATNALAMPTDTEVLRCVMEYDYPIYRTRTILYLLESRLHNNPMYTTQLLKYSAYTLEHLMPQKWWYNWPLPEGGSQDDRNHLVKTLGNCTIITQSLNSTISNDQWSVKLDGKNNKGGLRMYASGLLTLDGVLTLNEWSEATILERSRRLAEMASNVWKL